ALFLLVIGTAYLEAQGIWEPFRRRLSFEASNPPFDVGRPFDLRRIVGISSEGKRLGLPARRRKPQAVWPVGPPAQQSQQ
ncbi:hypothetical protein Celaphus_00005833, partial [Cervus elaphus hippelaphus]